MSDTRQRIAAHVQRAPGVHFRGLARALDLAPGQVQYHVRRLQRADRLVAEDVSGRTHYFPPEVAADRRRRLALLRRETARDVVVVLAERGPAAPDDVAAELDIARSTLEWHLEGLTEADLVAKTYDERGRVTLSLVEEERVADLLSTIQPGLPDRLVDRFTRLVDQLLAE